jgi:hypothetical protein
VFGLEDGVADGRHKGLADGEGDGDGGGRMGDDVALGEGEGQGKFGAPWPNAISTEPITKAPKRTPRSKAESLVVDPPT